MLDKLKTKQGYLFSQTAFDADLKMLAEEFDWVEPQFTLEKDQVHLTLHLWPKPLIHSIIWEGNQAYSSKKLERELEILPRTVFDRKKFNENFSKVKQFYTKKGYFESSLSYQVVPIENTNKVDIVIHVKEGRLGRVQDIIYKGLSKSEIRQLQGKLHIKRYRPLTSWLTGAGYLQEELLDQDQMILLNYFQEKGYADAKVDISTLDDPKSNQMIVQVLVYRGPIYYFGTIRMEGNTLFSTEEILKKLSAQKGETYSPEKIHNSLQAIKDLYGNKGYIDTQIQYESYLKEDSPTFYLDLSIQENQPYKIGLIHILGNHQTHTNVILRESLLVPGEVFDSRKLKATQTRLENIGYFKSVNVFAIKPCEEGGPDNRYRDVFIEVDETTTGSMSLFLGFSTADDIYGGLDCTERNFNIRGFGTLFSKGLSSLRGGGEFFHARASLGKKQNNYFITWMDPYFQDSLWRIGFELSKTSSKLQSREYDTDTYGITLFTSYPITNYWTYGLKYRFRHTETDVKKDAGKNIQNIDQSGILSALGTSLSYDSTDNSYKPHQGIRSSLESEIAGLGGKFKFFKLGYHNSVYFPVTCKTTLKFRGNLNFLQPLWGNIEQRIPISEKFFLGGEGTVRGYKPYILGPKKDGEPIGGVTSALVSGEYNLEVLPIFDIFAFMDGGSVSEHPFTPKKLRWSVGIGARIEVMQRTPIIIGYGYPINPKTPSDREKFFFSMGGQF